MWSVWGSRLELAGHESPWKWLECSGKEGLHLCDHHSPDKNIPITPVFQAVLLCGHRNHSSAFCQYRIFFFWGSNKWNCTICIFWGVWHVLLNIVFLVHQCFSCISQSFLLNSVLYYSNWRLQCVLNECIFGTVNIQVLELNDLVMTWYYIYFIIVYLLYYIPVLIVK